MQICHGNNWYLQSWVIITVMTYPKQKHTITMVCVQFMSKINLTGWYLYQSVPDLGLHQKCTIWSEKSLGVNTFRSTHSFTSEGQFLGEEKRSSWDTWHISTLLWSFGFHELLWPQILTAKLISSLISEGHFFGSFSWDSWHFSTLSMRVFWIVWALLARSPDCRGLAAKCR